MNYLLQKLRNSLRLSIRETHVAIKKVLPIILLLFRNKILNLVYIIRYSYLNVTAILSSTGTHYLKRVSWCIKRGPTIV